MLSSSERVSKRHLRVVFKAEKKEKKKEKKNSSITREDGGGVGGTWSRSEKLVPGTDLQQFKANKMKPSDFCICTANSEFLCWSLCSEPGRCARNRAAAGVEEASREREGGGGTELNSPTLSVNS